MDDAPYGENSNPTLQGWLEEVYFEGGRKQDLTRGDIVKVGEFVSRMLKFESSLRASAAEVVRDPWFNGG